MKPQRGRLVIPRATRLSFLLYQQPAPRPVLPLAIHPLLAAYAFDRCREILWRKELRIELPEASRKYYCWPPSHYRGPQEYCDSETLQVAHNRDPASRLTSDSERRESHSPEERPGLHHQRECNGPTMAAFAARPADAGTQSGKIRARAILYRGFLALLRRARCLQTSKTSRPTTQPRASSVASSR